MLAIAHPSVWPSALCHDVGTLVAIISQLDTLPACAPVNASMAALRLVTHDSGSGWIATPFPYDSFIHDSTPVYPGARHRLLTERFRLRFRADTFNTLNHTNLTMLVTTIGTSTFGRLTQATARTMQLGAQLTF
jgi:hypothetical protein